MVWVTKTAHLFQTTLEVCGVRLQANWIFYLSPFSAWIHLIGCFTFQALVFWKHPLFQGFACWKAPLINSSRKNKSSPRGHGPVLQQFKQRRALTASHQLSSEKNRLDIFPCKFLALHIYLKSTCFPLKDHFIVIKAGGNLQWSFPPYPTEHLS